MAAPVVVRVALWGQTVGAVSADPARPGIYLFEYAPEFVERRLEVAPLQLPLAAGQVYSFPELPRQTFHGLPGLLADSLPDRFGNTLIDAYMAAHGRDPANVDSLQRLLYIGRRGMGALEFEPALAPGKGGEKPIALVLSDLVESARRALRGEIHAVAPEIIRIGSSAAGARAKAVVGYHPSKEELVSGQFDLGDGFEHWLLKFDGVGSDGDLGPAKGYGRIEYAYHLMARAAGIDMMPCRLVEEGGRAHFMTKRFDRIANRKVHMQSLCALAHLDFNTPYVYGYEQYFRVIQQLELGKDSIREAFQRMAFNVIARNNDDHTKNLAFLMDEEGAWRLAPAFDVTYAYNPAARAWTKQHQMLVNGKADAPDSTLTVDDLLAVARKFNLRAGADVVDEVIRAVRRWATFADKAGVSEREAERIAAQHRLVRRSAKKIKPLPRLADDDHAASPSPPERER